MAIDKRYYSITGSIILLSLLLDFLGAYLLCKTYKWRNITTQQLLIFNICVCETIENLNWAGYHLLIASGIMEGFQYISYPISIYLATSDVLYFLMMLMTLDRLAAVVLNVKYPQYWTVERTKIVLKIIWAEGVVAVISFVLLNVYHRAWYEMTNIKYVIVGSSAFYNIVATITYAVIFWKYVRSKLRVQGSNDPNDGHQRISTVQTFVKSRFYVSVLIILTYLLFNTIPFCVIAILFPEDWTANNNSIQFIMVVLLHLAYLSDPLIYIFLQPDVRKQLSKLLSCNGNSTQEQVNGARISHTSTRTDDNFVISRVV